MDNVKQVLKGLKLKVSEAGMLGEQLSVSDLQEMYKGLKIIEGEIGKHKREIDIIKVPRLPKGDKHNPYPRMLFAMICEYYTRDKFYTIRDMMAFTGMSRNQVKNDMDRLEQEGYIKLIDGYVGERSTRFYKHKPIYL